MRYQSLSIVILGLLLSVPAHSASIYKCTKTDKTVIFTDKTCPANTTTTLVHKETEQEIEKRQQAEKFYTIKRLIEGNQANAAKEYATKNNLSEYYFNQLSLYSIQKAQEENQRKEDERQQQLAIEQQKLALQRQQLAAEKAKIEQQQQPRNNQNYYPYPYYGTVYRTPYYAPNSQTKNLFEGQINPSPSFNLQINPQQSFPYRHNLDWHEHEKNVHQHDKDDHNRRQ